MHYVIALGSNRRHPRIGPPPRVLQAALTSLADAGVRILDASTITTSRPLGPSLRNYANAAALIETGLDPEELLELLHQIEAAFGRRRGGPRWAERVLDLDLVLSDAGPWCSPWLIMPHPAFRKRSFVTGPVSRIAPLWRDPLTGFTVRQLHARLTRPRPLPR